MLAKFETKSSRVKGIAFHPTRPWILCSLHDGSIQLWDYRVGNLLDTFKEHTGPVRCVDFHSTQPLFVSGGDDYKVRVWNYNSERSLYTLMGHKDYIRTVQFHTENPWIVSCSDDQTIRIWNWQSRECIGILTGHSHYVMSALFHPTDDLIVSASLDQTIRVWDISGLKKKGKTTNTVPGSVMGRLGIESVGTVKFVLEGHERGVNWACFHPDLPLIVSGSDDRTIKIWRTNESRAWEIDTLRGHTNNVSCVLFHPHDDLILSDSEDHSIKVWDSTKRICVQTFLRTRDRFWIMAAHKKQNLIAAGHDSGAVVFKLRRERVPFAVTSTLCFYLKDRSYRVKEIGGEKRDLILMPVSRGPASMIDFPREMQYNHYCSSEHMILTTSPAEEGMYELLRISGNVLESKSQPVSIIGTALGACFISRNKFVTLENHDTLFIRNTDNIVTKRVVIPVGGCSRIFSGGRSGRVLLLSGDELIEFDVDSSRVLGSCVVSGVKRCLWNSDGSRVAVVAKQLLLVLTSDLKTVNVVNERLSIKDCCWDSRGILLYSTLNQLKYLLPSGSIGVVRSLNDPVYLCCVKEMRLFVFSRGGVCLTLHINVTEYVLKYCLETQQYREAIHIIRTTRVDSQALLGYLQSHGYQDIALHFVTEPQARFNLAIQCGNLDIALECASQLDMPEIWTILAQEALRQGSHEMVEMAYQKTHAFDRLSFLYVLTGNTPKLQKMLRIAELRQDVMAQFHTALFLGDVETRVRVLEEVGQLSLAYLTAVTNGLIDIAEHLREQLLEAGLTVPEANPSAALLMPPMSVTSCSNWPLLELPRSRFDRLMEQEMQAPAAVLDQAFSDEEEIEQDEKHGDEEIIAEVHELEVSDDGDDAWSDDLDLDSDSDVVDETPHEGLQAGASITSVWSQSPLAHDAAAAGDVDGACRLLNRQLGMAHVTALTRGLKSAYLSVQAVAAGYPGMPPLTVPLVRSTSPSLPFSGSCLSRITEQMKRLLKSFQGARFEECESLGRELLQEIPLCVFQNKEEEMEIHNYVELAREYMLAAKLDQAKKHGDSTHLLECVCLMADCRLQSAHQLLVLHSAMVATYKHGNFIDAAMFARRILSHSDISSPKNVSLETKARKVLAKSEREGRNALTTAYLGEHAQWMDSEDLTIVNKSEECEKCPYCGAMYRTEKKGKVCCVCDLAKIGEDTLGLVCVYSKCSVC